MKQVLNKDYIRYFISGLSGFAVDTFVLNIVQFGIFKSSETKILDLVFPSKIISSIAGLTVSFLLNRHWSFTATEGKVHHQALRFIGVFFVNVCIAALLYSFFFEILQHFTSVSDSLRPTASNFLTSATQMVINFFVYKFFVFKK